MTSTAKLVVAMACAIVPVLVSGQGATKPQGHGEGLDPVDILKPLADSWPTYSGDYSGKRYSGLTQINQSNVKNLSLAWVTRVTAGPGPGGGGGRGAGPAAATIIGGEGTGEIVAGGGAIRGAVLAVNGILYFTMPDNAWAVMTAARNGYYFVLDRTTGEHLVTGKFSDTVNWTKGINEKGQPVRDPKKDHDIAGALVSSSNGGAANWPPPAFSPDAGLFYVPLAESWAMYYLAETDPRGAMGLGGKEELGLGGENFLVAIDYRTGKIAWKQKYPSVGGGGGGTGLLTTAGRLLFAADAGGNIVARDPANGKPLWHARIGNPSNAPETYMLDGHQYVIVAAGDTLYAFTLN